MKIIFKYFSIIIILLGSLLVLSSLAYFKNNLAILSPLPKSIVIIRSIDTMKYSRDVAREKVNDLSFDLVIEKQVEDIANTGANYIAIGTPYDSEFIPFLKRWVESARRNHLKIWFRGNLSGWEQWFDYPAIDRQEHAKLTWEFITQNPDLFMDGDIFTSCSECENGVTGDPRKTGDIQGFRNFLMEEYNSNTNAFLRINKKVKTGYFSMNYDVASLIMNTATTKALGGIVAIDHYVASPVKLIEDAEILAKKSGGKIVFGEIGVPIPDLNGDLTESEQANWIEQALTGIFNSTEIIGVNYWVNVGGSTQLWNDDGTPRKAVELIKKFYSLD
jgi:hypothetical protein